jgi:transposase
MFQSLFRYVLPSELVDFFDLVDLQEHESVLHLYLDECDIVPEEYKDLCLSSNGFYAESALKDFPLRDKKVVLHLRRRRWVDEQGKSYSRSWDLAAEGTRYSREFAFFLKEAFGYLPDSSPIS